MQIFKVLGPRAWRTPVRAVVLQGLARKVAIANSSRFGWYGYCRFGERASDGEGGPNITLAANIPGVGSLKIHARKGLIG